MGFSHGKTARHFVDQYELSSFFNEFTASAKAGTAETTVFGKGAKTFIGGLKEGTISAKGYFDPGTGADDAVLAAALGRSTNMAVTHLIDGGTIIGNRVLVAYAAETDYSITSPVTGVNAVTYSAQSDSGLSSGSLLHFSVDTDQTLVGSIGSGSTTVAAGSNGVNTSTFTGAGTLNVASTTGFAPFGSLIVATGSTPAWITYTGLSGGNQFTGCTTQAGGGVLATSGGVKAGMLDSPSGATTGGFVSNLHVLTLTGTGQTMVAKIQHSADGATWVDLTSFNGGSAITAEGAYSAFVAYGTTVNKYLRAVTNTTGSTGINLNALVSAARQ